MLSVKTTKDSKGNVVVVDGTSFYNTNDASGAKIGISDTGRIIAKNSVTSLGAILNNLMIGLTTFNAALTTAAGASVVLLPLAAPAIALQVIVSNVQTDLNTLLEP